MAAPISIGLMVVSTALTAASAIQQGNAADVQAQAQQQMLNSRALQADMKANEERALTQRSANEERRQAELSTSRAQALTAASGGSTLDPSIVNLMGDLAAEGDYNAGIETFQGESRARDLEFGAELDRYSGVQERKAGKAARKAGFLKAGATVLKGGSSMYSKYGSGAGSEKIYWNDGTSGNYTRSGNVMRGYR